MMDKLLLISILALFPHWLFGQHGDLIFDHSSLHEIRLYFEEASHWDSLTQKYENHITNNGIDVPYLPAIMAFDGHVLDTVGVRLKGLSSYHRTNEFRKPFKIDFNEFSPDQEFDGIKKLNLANEVGDPSMLRNFIGYNIMREAGIPAPRVSFCKLYLNDVYWGPYQIIEQIDKTFVANHFSNNEGTLIKNIGWTELEWLGDNWEAYLEDFQLKTNEVENDWSNFINFEDILNNSSNEDFPSLISSVFDINQYLHVLATDIFTNNWDSYIDNRRNFYLYNNPADGKFHWIPWDYNLCLGGDFSYEHNPFRPIDTTCYMVSNFGYAKEGTTYTFFDKSYPPSDEWFWDFGDGNTSSSQNPIHIFPENGSVNVCLTASRMEDNNICQHVRCEKLDLSFNPETCYTVAEELSPFSANDPIFQQVVAQDDFCCEEDWDAICTLAYYEILWNSDSIPVLGFDYNIDYPVLLNDSDKVLINRLLAVPEFQDQYLNIVCNSLENNFNPARLFPLIDEKVAMLRPAIQECATYIYSWDYFEFDIGDGSGGGQGAEVAPIKWVIADRFVKIQEDLNALGKDCSEAISPIGWQEISINEILASNSENGGISDPDGEFDDWVEFYNNTNETVDLSSFYFSDQVDKPFKWKFPYGTSIAPNDFLIVWADKDETQIGLHANFKLAKTGESLFLRHQDGTLIDSVSYGDQFTNTAFARIPNGTGIFEFQSTTFNMNNDLLDAVEEKESNTSIRVFPNPSNECFYIQIEDFTLNFWLAKLFDGTGRIIQSVEAINTNLYRFDTSNLPSGIYWLTLQSKLDQIQKKIHISK